MWKRATVAVFLVLLSGFFLNGLSHFFLKSDSSAVIERESLRASAKSGAAFSIFGGYRSVLADFVWIKAYIDWERRNLPDCLASLDLATSIDPSMILFWTQGASIIAFDTPHWIMERGGVEPSAEVEKSIRERQAKVALKFIDRGLDVWPQNANLWLTKGQICIIALKDYKLAQVCYAKIVEIYGAKNTPVYIMRIYASILARNGYFKEAADTLKTVLAGLEQNSPIRTEIERNIKKAETLYKKTSTK